MQVAAVIPWLDIFLVLLFVGLVSLGFWQGLLKESWFLLSLYLAAVLASLYGDYLASLVTTQVPQVGPGEPGSAVNVSSAVGFFAVFALAVIILFAILAALFSRVRFPASLLWLDKAGGIVLGIVTAFTVTSLVAYILYALLGGYGPPEWAFYGVLKNQRLTSPLMQAFLAIRPVIMAAIRPWLPGELPAFLR
jgi:uncharacterized membrane protein required for colicin V production